MADAQWISVVDYLQSDIGFNSKNFGTIREHYQQECGGSFPVVIDDFAIKKVAQQLKIKIDDENDFGLLCDCVISSNADDSQLVAQTRFDNAIPSQHRSTLKKSNIISSKTNSVTTTVNKDSSPLNNGDSAKLLNEIDCLVNIKMAFSQVSTFIRSFLLQPISELDQSLQIPTISTSNPTTDQQSFVLDVNCLLYLFIREQMSKHSVVISTVHFNSTRFRLVESIRLNDEFDRWEYDHLRGLFDLELVPHDNNTRFPNRWHLADNVSIYCQIKTINNNEQKTSLSHFDRLYTNSLDTFVRNVCAQENNSRSDDWLKALRDAEIVNFEHLASLDRTEWDRIPGLTVNAKRILRAATDRHRISNVSEQRRQITNSSKNENKEKTEVLDISENLSISNSELYANLHLIKLYVCDILRDQPAVKRFGNLSKLETKCLDEAFKEMQSEGFVDDGLFSRMKEFFLPLTISQQELHLHWSSDGHIQRSWSERREKLLENLNELKTNHEKEVKQYEKYNDEISRVEKSIDDAQRCYFNKAATLHSKSNNIEHTGTINPLRLFGWKSRRHTKEQALILHQAYKDFERQKSSLLKKLNELQEMRNTIRMKITDFETQIEEEKERLDMIETNLNTPQQPVDNQLVKPPRGLLLYGPPGTGKSDILSKLAKKIGIVMVGPPLAAGELNRPLVGESERIIIALCSRCNQIPYAMCCVSIDEIDSLAPKRGQDSSEGKIDKISVLLSLIEGIKDISNLMILSATNRLHIMDEAFLRRMSGKFFVGRPSSNARRSILQKIPFWALEPEVLDQLSIATTNFSGAAVKALTRAITVKCIKMKLSEPMCEIEALQLADLIAQQYQIFIGSETLPRLLLRNQLIETNRHPYQLPRTITYTGRIIVDLQNQRIRIEIITKKPNTNNNQISVVERKLYPYETNVQTLLERLTAYGKSRNVQLLQLIDLNLLASQGAYDERKVYELLKDRYDECISYSRSMIVYDLDALVGIHKTQSYSNASPSISCSVHNQSIYTYVLARFRDRVMEDIHKNETDNVERWAIAVIREPFLLRQFAEETQFPRTYQEQEELELERRMAEELIKCVKCKDFYIENDNRFGSCSHHDGFVYDNSAADPTIYAPSDAAKILNKLERKALNDVNQRNEYERQKTKFKWICCDETFTTIYKGGCKKGKHGFFLNGNESSGRQVTNKKINRCEQATIEQWEDFCCNNAEYEEKLESLLNDK
ncbi:unnamed protein product [Rotaria sordida]|uniref:AAA+ ATPase domain-containing protein n=1 Tax=Rotaria sordida TaxID=392033 RepID=A0A819PCR6_9BILA|nr:unnamed protein product [Rotaria sordida]CAF4011548.1 unnamed protein product [Rotaria sordida]